MDGKVNIELVWNDNIEFLLKDIRETNTLLINMRLSVDRYHLVGSFVSRTTGHCLLVELSMFWGIEEEFLFTLLASPPFPLDGLLAINS